MSVHHIDLKKKAIDCWMMSNSETASLGSLVSTSNVMNSSPSPSSKAPVLGELSPSHIRTSAWIRLRPSHIPDLGLTSDPRSPQASRATEWQRKRNLRSVESISRFRDEQEIGPGSRHQGAYAYPSNDGEFSQPSFNDHQCRPFRNSSFHHHHRIEAHQEHGSSTWV